MSGILQGLLASIGGAAGGPLYAWGHNNNGQLGDDTVNVNRSSPVQVGNLTTWDSVGAGTYHGAAIKTDGTLWMWGRNIYGQLGDGTTINRSSPVQVGILTNWSKVSGGYRFTSALKTNGTLWAWGSNNYGQLGDNTIVYKSSPVQIGALTNWSKIAGGSPWPPHSSAAAPS